MIFSTLILSIYQIYFLTNESIHLQGKNIAIWKQFLFDFNIASLGFPE